MYTLVLNKWSEQSFTGLGLVLIMRTAFSVQIKLSTITAIISWECSR